MIGEKLLAHRSQMLQAFLQPEVGEVVGADLVAQEGGELLVLLDEGVLAVGAEDMMAVLDLLERGVELALELAGEALPKTSAILLSGHAPQADFAGALEEAVDGEVAFEDEVAAVLDLADSVEAAAGSWPPARAGRTSVPARASSSRAVCG